MAATALKRGIDIFTGYGMSETCPILTLSHLKADLVQNVGSGSETEINYRVASGLNGNLVELEIVDEDMNPQPHDGHSVGEVVARGPSLTAGYSKNPEATATLWKGGWLHTGDIGAIDENGYLRVLDRSKDVIKTGGEWISSLGLEDIILSNPAISEAAVIGIEDTRWGERPIAVVVLKPGAAATEDEIKSMIRTRTETGELSRYAIPDHVIFAESLEKTSVGKLDKKKMRIMYGAAKAA
jgi:fatty-acyl-CoA synthase